MFIKWRTYQKQSGGIKTDKYIQQPIVVKSYRLGKKWMKKKFPGMPEEAFEAPKVKKMVSKPRHEVVMKLPSFVACMVIYYRNPRFMVDRILWWKTVDGYFNLLKARRNDVTDEVVEKLKADIEATVPRVTPEEERQLNVVLNDLPLHSREGEGTLEH